MIIKRLPLKRDGLTLIELLIALVGMSVLIYTIGLTYITGLRLWNNVYGRTELHVDIAQALELVTKNLRQATSIDALTAGSITWTADLGAGSQSYRVYLYNAADAEPNPPYTQDTYELRYAAGTVTYGTGVVLASNIDRPVPPSTNPFSQDGNVITMNFTLSSGDNEVHMRTNVRVRNL